jgi:uncharacterized protein (DUF488 family)
MYMKEHNPENTLTLYSIGHSNHSAPVFLELLKKFEIQTLVDIRSSPYTKYTPHFNRDVLADLLSLQNIDYEYFGSLLGGRPPEPEFYNANGHVLYGKLAESERFQEGINRTIEFARYSTIAIMCSEEDPSECHRRLLVGRVLKQNCIAVIHIRGDGTSQTESEFAESEALIKDKGQLGMFQLKEEDEWKSIRSVSPRNPQANSSKFSSVTEYDY